MSLEVNVCSVTDLLVGTRYTPQQNLRGKRPTIMHGIAGRSLEDRATAGFLLTKNYLWLGAPSVILVHFAPVSSFPGPSSIPAQDPGRLPSIQNLD